jgi:hypothetical protein
MPRPRERELRVPQMSVPGRSRRKLGAGVVRQQPVERVVPAGAAPGHLVRPARAAQVVDAASLARRQLCVHGPVSCLRLNSVTHQQASQRIPGNSGVNIDLPRTVESVTAGDSVWAGPVTSLCANFETRMLRAPIQARISSCCSSMTDAFESVKCQQSTVGSVPLALASSKNCCIQAL